MTSIETEIQDIVQLIANTDMSNLEEIEKTIILSGLNNEILDEQPHELKDSFGKGLHMWQYPNQLSKLAKFLYETNASSYMEIGCRFGGTFVFLVETLRKKNPNVRAYACDIIDPSKILTSYYSLRHFEYVKASSWSPEFKDYAIKQSPEVVFIDADHSYEGVTTDFQTFQNCSGTKHFIFHDIVNERCPGVVRFWNELKASKSFNTQEFVDQYDSVNGTFLGIGVASRI